MKKTIKINASVSATIATGSYQNLKPGFLIEETLHEQEGDSVCEVYDINTKARLKELYDIAYSLVKEVENNAIIERIERERADLRFVTNPEDNKVYPSVTSIRDYDADFFCSQSTLQQTASQSNIVHAKVAHFIDTGKWVEAKELNDIWTDILLVKKGDLKLSLETGDFPKFLEKYPIEGMVNGQRLFNTENLYCGKLDFTGTPQFKDAKVTTTVFDVKRTADKVKDGVQISAYCKMANCKQGIIVPLNSKTEQGFSKPIIYDEEALKGYYKIFLQKRKEFKKRYNI